MSAPRPCPHCLLLALVFSAVLHGAAVRFWLRTPAPEPLSDGPLVLELAQFEPASADPVAEASVAPESAQPAATPPDITAQASPPSPLPETTAPPEPAVAVQAEPPPPMAEPLPRPRPKPKARLIRTKPVVKPPSAPKPQSRFPLRQVPTEVRPSPVPAPPSPSANRAGQVATAGTRSAPRATTRPPTPAERPRPGESEGAYLAEVQRAVARAQVYPEEARRARKTGTAVIAFVVQSNGRISGARLARSSGDPALDRAALAAVGRLGRVRPIPAAFGRSTWALQVPIRFALR